MKPEIRMTKAVLRLDIRTSSLLSHSCLVIRHSATLAPQESQMSIIELAKRIEHGEHLDRQEYLQLAEEASLETIQRLADALRRRLHPDNIVTYVVDRNINYSNVC